MISYASNTRTVRNLEALRASGWRIMISPDNPRPPADFRFSIDNGAWPCYTAGVAFDGDAFEALVEEHGAAADFVVIPDKVADRDSLDYSRLWFDRLKNFRLILLPLQDGMKAADVGVILERFPNMGLFLGGSTDWKLRTMYAWGMVAHAYRRYYHVGRVNTTKRVRLCAEAGADSFDGTSCTRYSQNVPKLTAARSQRHLLTPSIAGDGEAIA